MAQLTCSGGMPCRRISSLDGRRPDRDGMDVRAVSDCKSFESDVLEEPDELEPSLDLWADESSFLEA